MTMKDWLKVIVYAPFVLSFIVFVGVLSSLLLPLLMIHYLVVCFLMILEGIGILAEEFISQPVGAWIQNFTYSVRERTSQYLEVLDSYLESIFMEED